MKDVTENQSLALTALIKACLNNMGGTTLDDLQGDPYTWVDVDDLIDAGWARKEAEGTFGSLIALDYIYEDDEHIYALTYDWDELAKFHA